MAVISGLRSGYSVSTVAGMTSVTDTNIGDGDTGTVTLRSVEILRFNDQDVTIIPAVTVAVTLTSANNVYLATTSDNYLVSGLAGNDSITTVGGDDTITGGTGNDTINSGDGNDTVLFGTGSNGFDAVDGGAGSNDRIVATAAGVTIGLSSIVGIEAIDAGGFANVKLLGSTAANVFDLSATTLTGITLIDAGSGNDTVTGSAGANTIFGGAGNDALNGGNGDDTFRYSGTSGGFDVVDGGLGGNDRIVATANTTTIGLTALTGIEVIDAAGFTDVKVLGSSANNTLDFSAMILNGITSIDAGSGNDTVIGSASADTIIGGSGNDVLQGGFGDDLFRVGTSAGTDSFDGGAGTDTIIASAANVSLTVTGVSLTGIEAINSGGFSGLKLVGTSSANMLDFSGLTLTGVSLINGGSGNDTIVGSSGADVIEGNSGRDILTGGLGADVFDFNLTSHSRGSTSIDLITDFTLGSDHIDLSTIDANTSLIGNDAFIFIDATGFSGVAGQLRYDNTSIAGIIRILADVDGNKTVDMEIQLAGSLNLTASDFYL